MKLKISVLLLASILFSQQASAYQLLSIPPNGLYIIICGNGNTFPWQTVGPDGVTVMNAVAVGLCQGTIVSNSHFDVGRVDVKRLLAEQKPRKFSEIADENVGAPNALAGDPVAGVDATLEKTRGDSWVSVGVTDGRGNVIFRNVAPGDYVISIDGPTLARAMDALAPSKPERHGGQSSLSIGMGGIFGGGASHQSHDDGGPVGGSHRSSHGGSSSGGVGLGLNVPLGGHDTNPEPGYPITGINILLPSNPDATTINWGDGSAVSAETAYCRDSAIHGMKFHVSVTRGGTILLSIFDRWGTLSAISEDASPTPRDRVFDQR